MKTLIYKTFICLMLAAGITFSATAQQVSILPDESQLWIEGSSNVNKFQCVAKQYRSDIETTGNVDTLAETGLEVEIDIYVRSFDCGRSRMNRDLQDALKVRQFEAIRFKYLNTKQVVYNSENNTYTLTVEGILIVAGTERTIIFDLEGHLVDDMTINATGSSKIEMSDFNIVPPTAMMGLIKVDELLTVHFDLTAKFED